MNSHKHNLKIIIITIIKMAMKLITKKIKMLKKINKQIITI